MFHTKYERAAHKRYELNREYCTDKNYAHIHLKPLCNGIQSSRKLMIRREYNVYIYGSEVKGSEQSHKLKMTWDAHRMFYDNNEYEQKH